jgi:hypothetical protein
MSDCSLQSLVPSLEVCQSLKAAGFPQDTALCWKRSTVVEGNPTSVHIRLDADEEFVYGDFFEIVCAAPTAEEILKELPWSIQPWLPAVEHASLQVVKSPDGFRVHWFTWDNEHEIPLDDDAGHHEKESEAAALAYLWWKAQK